LYLFDAASNIAVKLVAEGLVVWLVVDIWKSSMGISLVRGHWAASKVCGFEVRLVDGDLT
jgi:hypothetical protein